MRAHFQKKGKGRIWKKDTAVTVTLSPVRHVGMGFEEAHGLTCNSVAYLVHAGDRSHFWQRREGLPVCMPEKRAVDLPLHAAVWTCFRMHELCDKPKLILKAEAVRRGKHCGNFFSQQPRKSSINVVPWSRRLSDLKMPLKIITKINYCYHCHP